MARKIELILGGARSGKSRLAEQRALDSALPPVYIATATAQDDEMAERIAQHQRSRDAHWHLVEEPVALADVLLAWRGEPVCLVVDCLTLWLSNCLHADCWPTQKAALIEALAETQDHVIMVSNETGLGVVPMGELSRQFVDESGFLHQQLASLCDRVTLTVAGLPVEIKPQTGVSR